MNNTPNTNNIWPNSTPKLNPNKPDKILPEFISVLNKNPPKPKPWMSPNTIVININKLSLFFKFSFRKNILQKIVISPSLEIQKTEY